MLSIKGAYKSPLFYSGAFLIISLSFAILRPDFSFRNFSGENSADLLTQHLFLSPSRALLPESPQLLFIQDTGVLAVAPAEVVVSQSLGAIFLTSEPEDRKKVITEYIVENGDTLLSLAEDFGVSVDTLIWANNLSKKSVLQVGQKMVIPPVSGVIHHVKEKDTISSIAQVYKGDEGEIIAFNELSPDGKIYIGDIVIVPQGVMPKVSSPPAVQSMPLAQSFLICPTAGCRISQGLHWYNAIDFNGSCGEPIRAAAGGTVLKVALTGSVSRYAFGGAGSHITLLHPNGLVTMYGHISASLVSQGEQVSQGQAIALMGGKPGTAGAGLSTGCHVHFGVTGAANPFAR